MFCLLLRVVQPFDGCVWPRRPDPRIADDGFSRTIAAYKNGKNEREAAIYQLADFAAPVVATGSNRQPRTRVPRIESHAIFKRLERNVGRLQVSPVFHQLPDIVSCHVPPFRFFKKTSASSASSATVMLSPPLAWAPARDNICSRC